MVGYQGSTQNGYQVSYKWTAVSGVLSGMMTRFLCQPLDVLKIRFQLQHEPLLPSQTNYYWNMRQACMRIFHEESIRALWKGHVPAQLLSGVYGLAQFGSFEILTKAVHLNVTDKGGMFVHFICGSISGGIATLVSMPCDTIRTRLVGQGEPKIYNGPVHAMITMIKTEGYSSLFKGFLPNVIQIMPHAGIQFAAFHAFTELYWMTSNKERERKLPGTGSLIFGSAAGLISKVAIYPLDLSKKRLQVQGFDKARIPFGKVVHYTGLYDCLRRTLIEEGISGVYKGLTPSLIKATVTTGLTFMFYEELISIFTELRL